MEKTLRLRDNVEIEVSIRVRQTMNYSPVTLAEHSSRITRSMTLDEIKDEIKAMSAESYDLVESMINAGIERENEAEQLKQSNG